MSATAEEQANSRQVSGNSGRIGYVVTGATTELEAKAAILAAAPATFGGFYRRDASADVSDDEAGTWIGQALYGTAGSRQLAAGEVTVSGNPNGAFQIRRCSETLSGELVQFCLLATLCGRPTHMTRGFELIASYAPPGKTAPNFGGALNVTDDGVQGVDVPPGAINETDLLISVEGMEISITKGGLLFGGLSFQNRADGLWDLAWDFEAACWWQGSIDEIVDIYKPGWAYLWTLFETREDAGAHSLTRRAKAVYVHRVHPEIAFADLGTEVIEVAP